MRTGTFTLTSATNSLIDDIVVGSNTGISTPDALTNIVPPGAKVGVIYIEIFMTVLAKAAAADGYYGWYIFWNPNNAIPTASYPVASSGGTGITASTVKRGVLDWGFDEVCTVTSPWSTNRRLIKIRLPTPMGKVTLGDHLQYVAQKLNANSTMTGIINVWYNWEQP